MFQTLLATTLWAFSASAQNIDVRDVRPDHNQTTTIEIRKGDKAANQNEALWEVVEGTADIMGDHNALKKEARADWKKACETWKKEFKDDNKDNKILSTNCGTPTCVNETEGTQCKSQATYKVKTKIN